MDLRAPQVEKPLADLLILPCGTSDCNAITDSGRSPTTCWNVMEGEGSMVGRWSAGDQQLDLDAMNSLGGV